jgi:VWFA-related protein
MKRFTLALAAAILAFPALAQQQTPFQEQIDVTAVLLDVIVTDPEGNQILGLTKDDFIVKENGVQQAVESVDYFTNRILLDGREEQAPFKVESVREDRYFIFFFDKPQDPSLLFNELNLARQAVRKFVKDDMKAQDRIAIVGHDVRLKVYTDFTNDPKQIDRALNEALRFGRGVTEAPQGTDVSLLRSIGTKRMIDETGTVYEALDALADSVSGIKARKNLVLFSPGVIDRNETISNGMITTRSQHLEPALESLNAANVTVYGVQLQRNGGATVTMLFHQRLDELSTSTGGEYFRINTNFHNAVEKIEQTNAGYYLVTYRAQHPKGTSGFQNVEVSVRNPELRVVARSGYQYGG